MIEITKENTAKAAERARLMEVKPKVRFVADRTFAVQSARNSNVYTVRFDVRDGKKFADCDCKAGQEGKYVCYHVASAIPVNIYRQSLKRQTVAA